MHQGIIKLLIKCYNYFTQLASNIPLSEITLLLSLLHHCHDNNTTCPEVFLTALKIAYKTTFSAEGTIKMKQNLLLHASGPKCQLSSHKIFLLIP